MAKETSEAGATPKPALALTDGTMRLNGHLAAEIGMTPSILLLQIEWMIRHMDNVHFIDGKWWITTSARSMSKKWFKGAITHETICRNLDKLQEMELIIQAAGEKQGDKRIITLNPDGCRKLKSVTFEQKSRPSESLTDEEKPVTKSDSKASESLTGGVTKSDSEPSENLTVPVRKPDADLKEKEESKTKDDSSEDHHQDTPAPAQPDPAPTPDEDDDEVTIQEWSNIYNEFGRIKGNPTPEQQDGLRSLHATYGNVAVLEVIEKARVRNDLSHPLEWIRTVLENDYTPLSQAQPVNVPQRPGTAIPQTNSQIAHMQALRQQLAPRQKTKTEVQTA